MRDNRFANFKGKTLQGMLEIGLPCQNQGAKRWKQLPVFSMEARCVNGTLQYLPQIPGTEKENASTVRFHCLNFFNDVDGEVYPAQISAVLSEFMQAFSTTFSSQSACSWPSGFEIFQS
jgi:hypothetical protein